MLVNAVKHRRGLMGPHALVYFYRRRLRVHRVQEVLAGIGIGTAVALVVSTLIAEGSIAGSTSRVVKTVVGPAQLQLRARGSGGFNERLLARVERLPGVAQAAPLLEQTGSVAGPDGRRVGVVVAGTAVSLAILDGLAHRLPISALAPGGLGLSKAAAAELGLTGEKERSVTLTLGGNAHRLKLAAVLGPESAGGLSEALAAVMPLSELQRLAMLPGRITRIIVRTQPGQERRVRAGLERIAAGKLTVAPADQDIAILRQALKPSDQASAFFAGVSAVLGMLLAFTAMLLTVPERRRMIADLRLIGTKRAAIVEMVLFQALCLGVVASLLGVAGGYVLSRWVVHQSTGYLAEAFTLGTSTVPSLATLLLPLAGGVLATCVASGAPLLDLRRGRRLDAVYAAEGVPGNALGGRMQARLALGAVACLGIQVGVVAAWPSLALPASVLIALATVLAVPLALAVVLACARALSSRLQGLTALPVALASLRATTLRSLVLAATGAVAIFGSVALGGARGDLLRGIDRFAHSYTADAGVWVINPLDNQAAVSLSEPVSRGAERVLETVPGVARVLRFQGGFLDVGDRRVWVIGRPAGGASHVLETQLVHGNRAQAEAALAAGGWVVVSQQLAEALGAREGGTIRLPTPSGTMHFRVAATSTNLAWSPGVVFMSDRDFSRAWMSGSPTALDLQLAAGASPDSVRDAVRRVLGPKSGLEASTAAERARQINMLTSEGLGRLGEISTLLLVAAVLAMAAALTSSVWQRRSALAGLRLSGVKPRRLRRILLAEALMMFGAGGLVGALTGIYGEHVIDGYLRTTTGFPVAPLAIGGRPLEVFAIVLVAALAVVATPGFLASRVSPTLALETE
jgi:putative ABC transport system permease protein